uniref:SRCR domain-containing protein n=2 Tax=Ornithorhynchus anatinus TaxID=9258 RepID=F6W080_ORNAN
MTIKVFICSLILSLLLPIIWTIPMDGSYSRVRLVGRGSPCAGTPQLQERTSWLPLCGLQREEAEVLCRQLGCGSVLHASSIDGQREGSMPIGKKFVTCNGTKSTIFNCKVNHNWSGHCDPRAEVICSGHREVRLVGGDHRCAGRLEVRRGLEWGTVCQSDLDLATAHVVCRELHCGAAVSMLRDTGFGQGPGPLWTQETFRCQGNESLLFHCPRGPTRMEPCSHSRDATVRCSEYRLVNGSSRCKGRVELQVGGSWGSLCATHWDLADAHVLCRQLGCGPALATTGRASFGVGDGPAWTDAFHCAGTEPHLWNCPGSALGAAACPPNHVATAICSGESAETLRLQGGQSRCDGRVEISLRGVWGRIVAEAWGLAEAGVVCRQLRCGEAQRAYNLDPVAHGPEMTTGPEVTSGTEVAPSPEVTPVGLIANGCTGNESHLTQCRVSTPLPPLVGTAWDVGIICSESEGLRLAGDLGRCAGRVEVLHDGRWGTVCDDSWDLADAQVVCRQLSCGVALGVLASAGHGVGTGPIWLDELGCAGNESRLWQCPSMGWGRHDCHHKEDAGVLCSEFTAVQLVSNSHLCAGRLEVFYNGMWGSVCGANLSDDSLETVCQHLGCGESGRQDWSSSSGTGPGWSWLDGILCREQLNVSLWYCPSPSWHWHACPPGDEVQIWCAGKTEKPLGKAGEALNCSDSENCTAQEKVRVRGGEDGCSGRVEVWHRGSWGTVCDDAWDLADAHVVCRQLGCGEALAAPGGAAFGPGTGTVWLDEVRCRGSEASLWDCPANPWGQADCGHKEDAAVNCSGGIQLKASPKTGLSAFPPVIQEILSSPWIASIVLGTLLCLLLAYLAIQTWRTNIPNSVSEICDESFQISHSRGLYKENQELKNYLMEEEKKENIGKGAKEEKPLTSGSVFLTGLANIQEDDYDDSGSVLVSLGELRSPLKQQGKHLEEKN